MSETQWKVGVLGSGDVGKALAVGFAKYGHDVIVGTRSPEKLRDWRSGTASQVEGAGRHGTIGVGSFADAAEFGDVVVLATLFTGTEHAIELAGPKQFAGKVVIDATNPLQFRDDGPPTLIYGHTDSGGEHVQQWIPNARVVKAFNIVGNRHMVDPDFPGGTPDMFICGNDADAKQTVEAILTQFGWNTVDIGGIEGSRLLEPLCILWVVYGLTTNTWDHAFALLRK